MWKSYKDTGDVRHRNTLVEQYKVYAYRVANRMAATMPPSVEWDDIRSMAIMGLIEAIDRFDTNAGVQFLSFAHLRILGSILDQIREQDWVPNKVRRVAKQQAKSLVKMNMGMIGAEHVPAPSSVEPHGTCDVLDLWDSIMENLTDREATILNGIYKLDLTQEVIGSQLGIGRAAVSIAHIKLLARFRLKLNKEGCYE